MSKIRKFDFKGKKAKKKYEVNPSFIQRSKKTLMREGDYEIKDYFINY